jgi:hypothetical protein
MQFSPTAETALPAINAEWSLWVILRFFCRSRVSRNGEYEVLRCVRRIGRKKSL